MRIIRNIKPMQEASKKARRNNQTIGFVPTMGALHQGHLSLIRRARRENALVVVSIFVNPAQFSPQEDFKKYPRNFKRDIRMCKSEGVDIIFYPDKKEMYPDNYRTYVMVEGLSDVLCGKFRPGHFKGVATVVIKLFNIVHPDIAYFGQKDAQQAIIIKKMVEDLNLPLKIKVMPTLREKDGMALSSRNAYLKPNERRDALVLERALNLAKDLVGQGKRNSSQIIRKMRQLIEQKKSAKVQYISIVDLENLKPVAKIKEKALIALAVSIGRTRLVDNIIVRPLNA
ncbi:MAG: pantoate--beta-alanine ligase [Candidatus Omnitrophota bacterium]|nr:pantoate--beta-alanine ligase [Candidatus Omnitrophota bacterium]